jgi:hypothetical protein
MTELLDGGLIIFLQFKIVVWIEQTDLSVSDGKSYPGRHYWHMSLK